MTWIAHDPALDEFDRCGDDMAFAAGFGCAVRLTLLAVALAWTAGRVGGW